MQRLMVTHVTRYQKNYNSRVWPSLSGPFQIVSGLRFFPVSFPVALMILPNFATIRTINSGFMSIHRFCPFFHEFF